MRTYAMLGITSLVIVGMAGLGTYTVSAMQGPNAQNGTKTTTQSRQANGTGDQAQNRVRANVAMSDEERDAMRAQNQADCDGTGIQQHQRLHQD